MFRVLFCIFFFVRESYNNFWFLHRSHTHTQHTLLMSIPGKNLLPKILWPTRAKKNLQKDKLPYSVYMYVHSVPYLYTVIYVCIYSTTRITVLCSVTFVSISCFFFFLVFSSLVCLFVWKDFHTNFQSKKKNRTKLMQFFTFYLTFDIIFVSFLSCR